jgi:subtilisin family serine protease
MNFIKALLLLILLSTSLFAQFITQKQLNKLDPYAGKIVRSSETMLKNTNGEKLFRAEISVDEDKLDEKIGISIGTNYPGYLKNAGYQVVAKFDGFVTARIKPNDLLDLIQLEYVNYVSIGPTYYTTNDIAKGSTGTDLIHSGYINSTSYTGSGVIVCIIDTGIDWEHLDFRDPTDNTKSRILNIWDQTLTEGVDGDPPSSVHSGNSDFSGFTTGVEYTKADIEDEIDGSPNGNVKTEDTNGHGTHVAGTAAGNGASLSTNKYGGIAPDADIIIVKAGNGSFSNTNVNEGIAWAEAIADEAGKPIVINMSLGGHSGAHDGTGNQESVVDGFAGTGKVAVISAGNEGNDNIHVTGTIGAGANTNISIVVPSHIANPGVGDDSFGFDLWHDDAADFTVTVTSPNSQVYSRTTTSQGTSNTSDGSIYIFNAVDGSYSNGDTRNYVTVTDYTGVNVAAGTWTINIQNNSGATRTYHGWLFRSNLGGQAATLTGGNTDYTVGMPGTATEAITVGSHVERWRWSNNSASPYWGGYAGASNDISAFSSIGPRRDGAQKPDITAHGDKVASSTSQDYTPSSSRIAPGSKHHFNQGTSMSGPVVAGFVALLLQQNNSRTAAECKSLITGNADTDSYTGAVPNNTWGYGKLNAFESMAKAVNSGFTVDRSIYVNDDWSSSGEAGISANVMLARKFTPTSNGTITGLLFHASTTVNFTGNLSIEIWSDNGSDLPNAKLGNTVSLDVDAILPFSWNFVDLTAANVNATSGTIYHAVLYFTTGTSFFLLHDNSNSGGNSINTGSWASYTNGDLKIRPFVSTQSSALPVELISFQSYMNEDKVVLEWQTATEINNYGFEVERKIDLEDSEWENIGFVAGNGNSNSPKIYEFVDENPPLGNLEYRLKQIDTDGSFEYYSTTTSVINAITDLDEEMIPTEFSLSQNYPNPFNPTTSIEFAIPESADIFLVIFNTLGQRVAVLVDQTLNAGYYERIFDSSGLSSGLYIYQLKVDGKPFQSKKMVLMK